VGAFHGIRAALASIKRAELVMRDMPMHDAASRAAALKRAVDHVKDGGIVVATIDGPGGSSTGEVTCLGRRIVLRRGPFVLTRLTRAPLIPVVCAWTPRGQIEVRHGPPIDPAWDPALAGTGLETAMAARIASWLDGYLRDEPQEIWLSTLRHFLAAPLADRAANDAADGR
jgi:lauroyl/myristoyl acyltransferase